MFSNELTLEDESRMKLDYCLTERYSETEESKPYYGIRITKHLGDDVEYEEVTGLSYSREKVEDVLQILFRYEVTPISMVEIVDDLVTLGALD